MTLAIKNGSIAHKWQIEEKWHGIMNKHLRPPRSPGKNLRQAEPPAAVGEGVRHRVRLKVDGAGRILIPAEMRAAMRLGVGGTVLAWLQDGALHLVSPETGARQAQAMARTLIGGGTGLADELIAERREEVRRERGNG